MGEILGGQENNGTEAGLNALLTERQIDPSPEIAFLESATAQRQDYYNEVGWLPNIINAETKLLKPAAFCKMLGQYLAKAGRDKVILTYSEKYPNHRGQLQAVVKRFDEIATTINNQFASNKLTAEKLELHAKKIHDLCYF